MNLYKRIICLLSMILGLQLILAYSPFFSCVSFAGQYSLEEDDDEDGDEDDWDEDDPEDGLEDDEEDDEEEDEEEGDIPDDSGKEPYETIKAQGYKAGYSAGMEDALFDCLLIGDEEEERRCQLNAPDSLYNNITDEKYTVSYNEILDYPEEYLPVSGEEAMGAFLSYADSWKEGYRDGYTETLEKGAGDKWYELGHAFGYLDAVNDTYDPESTHGDEDGRIVEDGYYEPDHKDSLYNTLQGKYGDSYRAGYDAGWKDGINEFPGYIDLSSKDFDPWRISTCPLNWDTADRFVVETGSDVSNVWYSITDKCFYDYEGDTVRGRTAACSPFDYFFVESDTYIKDGVLIDRKKTTLKNNVNTEVDAAGNWLYRAVDAGNGLYVLIRYQVGDHSGYDDIKVKRYVYSRAGGDKGELKRETVTDHLNNYYKGNEPVVPYDSRAITDVSRKYSKDGDEEYPRNTKKKRREITVDAKLIYWEKGKAAEDLGNIRVVSSVRNSRTASVSSDHIVYTGDQYINLIKVDEKDRYYRVSKERVYDGEDREKETFATVSFSGIRSIPGLDELENRKNKVRNPVFTLKLKSVDKEIKKYKKAIRAALKDQSFNFEIARFKIDKKEDEEVTYKPYWKYFYYHSDLSEKVNEMKPAPIRRRDFDSAEEYEKAKAEYDKAMAEVKEYLSSNGFKKAFEKELKDARAAYMEEYRSIVTKYGKDMTGFEEHLKKNVLPFYPEYKYVRKYSEGYYKDGNKDGKVTSMEQWEYEYRYGPSVLNELTYHDFNGKLDPGENVIPDSAAWNAEYDELPEMEGVSWLSGDGYNAVTTVYLDYCPDGFYGNEGGSDEPDVELNEELFTYNEDVKLSLGKTKIKTDKNGKRLLIKPCFLFYSFNEFDDEMVKVKRKKIKISGKQADFKISDKEAAGQPILVLQGINNFEGTIALRKRENGETGFGYYFDDNNNFICEASSNDQ